ncbi:MAG: glycosyltransferase family 4 protein [Saonia sp.]
MQKVLIITYYWPPAGGPGVQRWLKFVKYLREFDIEPVVYVPQNPNYPIWDETLKDEVPDGITIYRHRIFEPYGLAGFFSKKKTKRISSGMITSEHQSFMEKVLLWVRGNLFVPDARKFWIKPSVRFLSTILNKEEISTIITTGPPHSVHLIGYKLKQKHQLRWVADFRDPWTSIGYHKKLKLTRFTAQKHKRLEHLVLNTADKIVVTSNTTKKEIEGLTDRPIAVITNGYDVSKIEEVPLDSKFTISHIGSLLGGRNPKNLWKVLAELIEENEDFKASVRLQFIGVVSQDVLQTIYERGLKAYTSVEGYLPHDTAVRYQRRSQVLLVTEIDSDETKGIIPGKLFEYMAAGRPVLAIGPKNWEVDSIITETKIGAIFDYRSDSDLKSLLLDWFLKYQKNQLVVPSTNLHRYSRRELTGKLAAYLQWE